VARDAMKKSRAPRNGSFRFARRAIIGSPKPNARNSGIFTTRASMPANQYAFSRFPTGRKQTSGPTSARSRFLLSRCISQPSVRWCSVTEKWIMVDDDRLPLESGEKPQMLMVRFRTLGCYPLTAAIESAATTLDEIVAETLGATTSERQGRIIDHDGAGSMERKKQEGYF
jgi:hypothetical protein